jgi:hypothetical protein
MAIHIVLAFEKSHPQATIGTRNVRDHQVSLD